MQRPQRIEPGPGQESVWDYPRPPAIEAVTVRLRVRFGGVTVADTNHGHRILETSQAPAYYFPPGDVRLDLLVPSPGTTFCEWKGKAHYHDVVVDDRRAARAAWSYPTPSPAYVAIADHLAFYPALMDECFVGDQRVSPMDGDFYGGWITPEVVGPFKGAPGTRHW